jgi:hypothetical protein
MHKKSFFTPSVFVYCCVIAMLLGGIVYNVYQHNNAPLPLPSVPVVIELFSSENCPTCPQAEKILAELSNDPNVMALSCHVTYWNAGAEPDEFARDFCEVRQHGYASLTEEKQIFTPQMMVNGGYGFVGYKRPLLKHALNESLKHQLQLIDLNLMPGGILNISLPALEGDRLHIWAFGYKAAKGKINNPALSLDNLGTWDGTAQTLQMNIRTDNIDGMLVLAQDNAYGRIVAAGRVDLR